MSAAERAAVHDLLVGFFGGFDERRTDDAFHRETFTPDAPWRFSRGNGPASRRSSSTEGSARPLDADSRLRLERAHRV
jgi:hypothetical protein